MLTENAGEGTDTVQAKITYILGSNLENLTLTGSTNINGTGNRLDNVITGNSGYDILSGGDGNDTLYASTGGAEMHGGNGNDILDGRTGNWYTDLYGEAGDDTLYSSAYGGASLRGGTGSDTYILNNTTDVITENAGEGTDTVQVNATYTLGANLENLTLTGTGNINGTGNALNNTLIGNAGSNTLSGGAGNDTLDGGTGVDTLRGGLGDDTYLYRVGSGNDTVNSYEGTSGNGIDTIQFQNLVLASIGFSKVNSDLVCTITQTGETVRFTNWTLGSNYQVDNFQFSDTTLTATQVNQRIS